MPAYDYKCPECDSIGEVFHGMNESPVYLCPDCEVEMKRVYNSFGVNHGRRLVQGKINDKLKHESDMKTEMKEEYGVESFQPIAAQSMVDVYNDVKASGSFVKERMQAETEKSQAQRKKKSDEWKKKAMKRAPQRSREKAEQKKKEAASKNAIRI